jgi:hypothetical protein
MTPPPGQAVVFVISHDAGGTVGLILNRPTGLVLGRKSGGLPFEMAGGPPGLQEVFADNRVYCGGFLAQQVGAASGRGPQGEGRQAVGKRASSPLSEPFTAVAPATQTRAAAPPPTRRRRPRPAPPRALPRRR